MKFEMKTFEDFRKEYDVLTHRRRESAMQQLIVSCIGIVFSFVGLRLRVWPKVGYVGLSALIIYALIVYWQVLAALAFRRLKKQGLTHD